MSSSLLVLAALLLPLMSLAADQELDFWTPNPIICSLVVANFTYHVNMNMNDLGGSMFFSNGTNVSIQDNNLILDTKNAIEGHPLFVSKFRISDTCFNGTQFEYLSLTLKTTDDIIVSLSANNEPCKPLSEVQYITRGLQLSGSSAYSGDTQRVDIPLSNFGFNFSTLSNLNDMAIYAKPGTVVEIGEISLRKSCDKTLSSDTVVSIGTTTPPAKPESVETFLIEDFAKSPNMEFNVHNARHTDDGTMQKVDIDEHGVTLTSNDDQSYWHTVLPDCMSVDQYDELVMTVNGPVGADFTLEIEMATKGTCDVSLKRNINAASEFLKGTMNGADQQLVVPLEKIPGFDKAEYTIKSIFISNFRIKGYTSEKDTPKNQASNKYPPLTIVVKTIGLRGNGDVGSKRQETVAKKEELSKQQETVAKKEDPVSKIGDYLSKIADNDIGDAPVAKPEDDDDAPTSGCGGISSGVGAIIMIVIGMFTLI